ncbi:hypothetical protein Acsp03_01340 [Actinomadura sp. NBRC 104412]|uniref:DUF4180 domain-containing protein n=1 Tax=Actinomadura sp. NBRC 104412 TaxID=3032203 RepID=UPI0024A16401|nr:DUF4180 domain-containing protein [Actinomadura sp. NBRC 104412]GLZ02667.1 hypothetical protein Acsp03_01340 [Actinomadura sp. NBRC 104412]
MTGEVPVLVCPAEGPAVRSTQDALDLLGEAFAAGAVWVALPVERLDPDFFRLRTRVAGEIAQKFVQYKVGLAIVGDISEQVAESSALGDLVRESNRGRALWFVDDLAQLRKRLGGGDHAPS